MNENNLIKIQQDVELPNPNTGGTGCYCPHRLAKPTIINKIIKEIVNPIVNSIYNDLGWDYKGVLYFGLNLDETYSIFDPISYLTKKGTTYDEFGGQRYITPKRVAKRVTILIKKYEELS